MNSISRAWLLLGVATASPSLGQIPQHIIRGNIRTDSGVVIAGADVIVTVAPTANTIATKSDSAGSFTVRITETSGEYILYVGALGRRPFRQRVSIASPESVAVVSVVLAPQIVSISAIRVQAQRARPTPSLGNDGRAGTDATDKTVDGASGALSPDQQGDVLAMASTISGLSVTSDGFSTLGLSSSANTVTINGLAFAGTDLPRDARTAVRFRSSPWDPTIGGFSGAQASVSLLPGTNVATRRAHLTVDAPALQVEDPVGRLSPRTASIAFDEGGTGAFVLDKLYYNFGIHVARQTAPAPALSDFDRPSLMGLGVSADSVERFVEAATSLGIPVNLATRHSRTATAVSVMSRLDRILPPGSGAIPPSTTALTLFGKYSRAEGLASSPAAAATLTGHSATGLVGAQVNHVKYFGRAGDYVNETSSGLSYSGTHTRPYAEMPMGTVLLASNDGVGFAAFGGNSSLHASSDSWTWETLNQTSMLAKGRQNLPIKIYVGSRVDGIHVVPSSNRLGTYGYASLEDLRANQPVSFTRTLSAPRSNIEWTGVGALAGSYVSNTLTITGGARIDANVFTAKPSYNPVVDDAFGIRTDQLPRDVALSPRVGFVWRYTPSSGWASASVSGATLNHGLAQFRGGIGKFRGLLPVSATFEALDATGLADGRRQMTCLGAATPIPNWAAFAQGAEQESENCLDGGSFADVTQTISMFDPSFEPPYSWRANLGWTTSSLLGSYIALDALYSRGERQPGTIDANFAGVQGFEMSNEANRPVYVSAQGITTGSGAVSPTESRRLPSFGRVLTQVSDLSAEAKQLSATLMPNLPLGSGVLVFGYTYLDARSSARGFDAPTGDDPRVAEWAPSSLGSRHTIVTHWARRFAAPHMTVSGMFRAASGLRFTPMVLGDVNGDGRLNDRAFVFEPSLLSDTALANGMRRILRDSPARACLQGQMRRIASRNSCTGPWSAIVNGSLAFSDLPRLDSRTRVNLSVANITGGLDWLLHGTSKLHGWGTSSVVDQTLYLVDGFDSGARQFQYRVNPRFGRPIANALLKPSPFRLTLDIEVGLGPTPDEQRLQQNLRVKPALVGTRASADTIKARYLRSAGTDIYAQMLRMSDSLALSRSQVERFRERQLLLRRKADSIYTILAAELVALPDDFNPRAVAVRVNETRDALWREIRAERTFVIETLTPGQIRLLPGPGLQEMIMNPESRSMFFSGGWTP